MSDLYEKIYSQDNPDDGPHGWIQWKGTDVCIDLHCSCGDHAHIDGWFFYRYECRNCHKKYAVGCNVKLIEMTPELLAEEAKEPWGPQEYLMDHSDD